METRPSLTLLVVLRLKRLIAGEVIARSRIECRTIDRLIKERILQVRVKGRSCRQVYLPKPAPLYHYLENVYGIKNLDDYIALLQSESVTRGENILVTADSKATVVRTFQGFLLNTFHPITLTVNGEDRLLQPSPGWFTFVYDYRTLQVPTGVTIVGVENPENFRYIERQKELFKDINPLFVSRYPQSQHHDFVVWMQTHIHPYLHYGDFDLAGILIYQNEYLKKLGSCRCSFLVPDSVEQLLPIYGNRDLYDKQLPLVEQITVAKEEKKVSDLLELIHREHKGLEQEIFIKTLTAHPE